MCDILKLLRLGALEVLVKDKEQLSHMLTKANETITYATRHGVIYKIDIYKVDNS